MSHVVLLGDSIFDNGAYTRGEPDVIGHLRHLLPPTWTATLCAVDGATTQTLSGQLHRMPASATHLVVSIGGNDALRHTDLLDQRATTGVEFLELTGRRVDAFEHAYRSALRAVTVRRLPTTVCTIYNGNLDRQIAAAARTALAIFDDAIVRTALDLGCDVIELRTIAVEPSDYANPIEPSGGGGLKIARAIARAVGAIGGSMSSCRLSGARERT
jgi:hypothetical protein